MKNVGLPWLCMLSLLPVPEPFLATEPAGFSKVKDAQALLANASCLSLIFLAGQQVGPRERGS